FVVLLLLLLLLVDFVFFFFSGFSSLCLFFSLSSSPLPDLPCQRLQLTTPWGPHKLALIIRRSERRFRGACLVFVPFMHTYASTRKKNPALINGGYMESGNDTDYHWRCTTWTCCHSEQRSGLRLPEDGPFHWNLSTELHPPLPTTSTYIGGITCCAAPRNVEHECVVVSLQLFRPSARRETRREVAKNSETGTALMVIMLQHSRAHTVSLCSCYCYTEQLGTLKWFIHAHV
uniref:Uncharacterized protein n=1 Tax=Seriola dumerili TaxID=41447 RepID=A0A3B4UMR3_SERDU